MTSSGAVWVLTAALMSLCIMLAIEAGKVRIVIGYPEMLPLGKCLMAESAVHVAVW